VVEDNGGADDGDNGAVEDNSADNNENPFAAMEDIEDPDRAILTACLTRV
jgi:hypothetical protein